MKIWSLLLVPAIGAGSFAGSMVRNDIEIQVNNEKINVNPIKFNQLKDSFNEKSGVNFNEFKDNTSKQMKIILPCWNGDLLTEYKTKENNVGQGKLEQHLKNFKNAWKSIEQKIKEILNRTYGCKEIENLEFRVGVIDFETIKEQGNQGIINGKMKKINSGGGDSNIEFTFNWKRNAIVKNYQEHDKIIRLYEASIGGDETKKKLNIMVYEILREAARRTMKNYKWGKLGTTGSIDIFKSEYSKTETKNKEIQRIVTGGAIDTFELSQWCFSKLDECTKTENWKENKLFEFFSSCWRNKVTGGEKLLSEFVEQVKKVIKGNKSDEQEKCNLWEGGIICSKGGLIYKK
ncbi:hypothetical protein [Mycoplasma parvum]|uniref:Uncharacterized protein n=1 Tax=Mycoplasma parvum str. Indiana TaxID=1403316 RepID=U5NCH3_9MOLU|nr:hypothetical protein [Mycoplasma parvum]AGX89127.1 hypothetical protein PRV_01945 [Mycoplasma parvum str. Indiana]